MAHKELEEKLFRIAGGQEFKAKVDHLSADELNNRISRMQQELEVSETHKEENEALKRAREEVKELNGPYVDFKKAIKIKTKYIVNLLKEKQKGAL